MKIVHNHSIKVVTNEELKNKVTLSISIPDTVEAAMAAGKEVWYLPTVWVRENTVSAANGRKQFLAGTTQQTFQSYDTTEIGRIYTTESYPGSNGGIERVDTGSSANISLQPLKQGPVLAMVRSLDELKPSGELFVQASVKFIITD